jgi:hypothetical protein
MTIQIARSPETDDRAKGAAVRRTISIERSLDILPGAPRGVKYEPDGPSLYRNHGDAHVREPG